MYQSITIVGNLGSDPEMRYTAGGTAVTNFSVATNRRWSNSDGEKQEEVTWFRVSCWGKLAEITNEYLQKGRPVLIEGRLQPDANGGPRVWEASDGTMRASFEITANTVRFIGGSADSGARPQKAASPAAAPPLDPDIPF